MSEQRTVLVTGVSRGLGLAMVEEFVERGHRVVGCARTREAVRTVSGRFGPPHRFDVLDVSDDEQVAAWSKSLMFDEITPDLLLNNAAIINTNAMLWDVPLDEFNRVIDINIKGVFHVVRHVVPRMIERGAGVIVNFSSGWGRSVSAQVAPYCATKWAIEGMTQALAAELPYGMAAIPLNPGVIHTKMLESCFGENASDYVGPKAWARRAVPFLLELGPEDNGDPLTAPG